jgi:hypothetical protein
VVLFQQELTEVIAQVEAVELLALPALLALGSRGDFAQRRFDHTSSPNRIGRWIEPPTDARGLEGRCA